MSSEEKEAEEEGIDDLCAEEVRRNGRFDVGGGVSKGVELEFDKDRKIRFSKHLEQHFQLKWGGMTWVK